MRGSKGRIELYIDPCCPSAWIACQWLAEVRRHRAVKLGLHLMSLTMLNEHQPISLGYRRLLAHTWGPARVAAATVALHGPDALEPLYGAMARRIFTGADPYRVIREDLDSVIVDARPRWDYRSSWLTQPQTAPTTARYELVTTRRWHQWAAVSARRSFISALPPSSGR